jgi:hypothetical protein
MDAQSVFAEIKDSSEYINTEIHLIALKNWIGPNSCHAFQQNLWIRFVVYTVHIITCCCRLQCNNEFMVLNQATLSHYKKRCLCTQSVFSVAVNRTWWR